MKSKLSLLWIITCLFLISCNSNFVSSQTKNETPSPEVTSGVYPLISPTTTIVHLTDVNNNEIETSTVIEESQCELPCWQGVLPGVTTWTDLGLPPIDDQIISVSPFRQHENVYEILVGLMNGKFQYFHNRPLDYESMKTKFYVSSIDLDTLQRVDIGENNRENPYTIALLFQLYGEPIDLKVWRYFIGAGEGYIHVGFYFPEHGIVAKSVTVYEGPDTGMREICVEEKVFLQLWNPEELLLFEDYPSYFHSVLIDHLQIPLPSNESIESYMNISSYEELLLKLADGQYCFEFNLDGDW